MHFAPEAYRQLEEAGVLNGLGYDVRAIGVAFAPEQVLHLVPRQLACDCAWARQVEEGACVCVRERERG